MQYHMEAVRTHKSLKISVGDTVTHSEKSSATTPRLVDRDTLQGRVCCKYVTPRDGLGTQAANKPIC